MKKLLVSFLIGIVLFFSVAPILTARAADTPTWYDQSLPEWYMKVYDKTNPNEIFGERYTAAQVQWVVWSIPSMFINWVLGGNTDAGGCIMGIATGQTDLGTCFTGLTNMAGNLISIFSLNKIKTTGSAKAPSIASQIFADRPISGISYVRNVVNKLNPVTTVSAANGYGINVIVIVAPLWKAVRNISYFLFIIVAIVFAFMIMFRVKLSPQVVISVQSALPKLIVALILVTFSFAIAGFMIDLMYVIMAIFSTFAAGAFSGVSGGNLISSNAVFQFINGTLFGGVLGNVVSLIIYFIIYLFLLAVAIILAFIASAANLGVGSTIFSLGLVIFWVILILVCVWYIFKVTYVLFKNLAEVYGLIIIAPLQITLGVLFPQMGFGAWFKKLFIKLMVFPLTGMFIYISYVLLAASLKMSLAGIVQDNFYVGLQNNLVTIANAFGLDISATVVTGQWGPPMLGNPASATAIAFILMSIGIFMMIPKIGESIESFLAGKGFAGTSIGEATGPVGQFGMGYAAQGLSSRGGSALPGILANEKLNKWLRNHKEVANGISSILDALTKQK